MAKKLLAFCIIFISSLSHAFTGQIYLGPMLYYQSVTSNGSGATNARYQSWNPSFALGYGGMLNEWLYLAGELSGAPAAITIHNNSNSVNLRTTYSYAASVIPGVAFDDVFMGYGRIGAILTHFKSFNTDRLGYLLALGIQARFTDAWSVRGEYDYSRYREISDMNTGIVANSQFGVGLVYQFC